MKIKFSLILGAAFLLMTIFCRQGFCQCPLPAGVERVVGDYTLMGVYASDAEASSAAAAFYASPPFAIVTGKSSGNYSVDLWPDLVLEGYYGTLEGYRVRITYTQGGVSYTKYFFFGAMDGTCPVWSLVPPDDFVLIMGFAGLLCGLLLWLVVLINL